MLTKTSVTIAACVAALAATALADVPREVTFQGKLTGNGTEPVSIELRFYDAAIGANLLWSEKHPSAPRPEGLFSINIGSETPSGIPDDALEHTRQSTQLSRITYVHRIRYCTVTSTALPTARKEV